MAGQSFLNDVNRQFDAATRFVPMQDGLAEKIRVCNATYVKRSPSGPNGDICWLARYTSGNPAGVFPSRQAKE